MSDNDNNGFETRYKDWHQKISFIKSGIRITACLGSVLVLLTLGHYIGGDASMFILAGGFALAEILGIAEEWL